MSAPSSNRYDFVVIGAGHNGLVCAAYLARAGRSVLVLEAGAQPGGAAITREFAPGLRVSAGAHLLHQLSARIVADLALERHGLKLASGRMPTTALATDAPPLLIEETRVSGVTARDVDAYAGFSERMQRFARVLEPVLGQTPPQLGTDAWSDRRALLGLGWRVRRLGRRDMRELLRIGAMNAHDLLEEHFESPRLKGALAFDAVLGSNFGPRSPGTVLTLLHRYAAQLGAGSGLTLPVGGMGAVTAALATAATAAGATVRTQARVRRVMVTDDAASGVELESGERIAAGAVVSNADPKTTLLSLLGAEHLDTGFVRRVHHLRSRGLAAKLHIALAGPPTFPGAELRSRLVVAPSAEYVERAFNHSKYGECSVQPALEIVVPTACDASLAPEGRHVLSVVAQYAPYDLRGGWAAGRESFIEQVLTTLEAHAPGLRTQVRAVELLAPPDLEREFGHAGGHWHHAELAFDQFFMLRPVPQAAQYRTPMARLYLCGAGCHPGGGVTGLAGRNAALEILAGAP